MTPKEKAKEIVDKILPYSDTATNEQHSYLWPAKQCALIAVDEIIKITPFYSTEARSTIEQFRANDNQFMSYWDQVREAIKNL